MKDFALQESLDSFQNQFSTFCKRKRWDDLADEMNIVFPFVWKSMRHHFDWSRDRSQELAYFIDFAACC